jgi:glyoxylase-like metal-dependent hydrolase (beta-lactamase superfamily II)
MTFLMMDFTVIAACLIENPETRNPKWFLSDTGLENAFNHIVKNAEKCFGKTRPQAIILTHGHFEHVGSVKKLIKKYYHFEIPYLTAIKSYPLGNPNSDSSLITKRSPTYHHTGIDISNYLNALSNDGTLSICPIGEDILMDIFHYIVEKTRS